jgi:hypothetical protein
MGFGADGRRGCTVITFSARGAWGCSTRNGAGGGFRGGMGRAALLGSTFAGRGFSAVFSGGFWIGP